MFNSQMNNLLQSFPSFPLDWPQFFTATILNWQHLLADDKYKKIVTNSLRFLVEKRRIQLFAFVIMSNHIHLIWQPFPPDTLVSIQHSLLKFTAQSFKAALQSDRSPALQQYKVKAKDRYYQFWERNSLSIEICSSAVFNQKADYIHLNPVKAGICKNPEDYHYSSARFYETGIDEFNMLSY